MKIKRNYLTRCERILRETEYPVKKKMTMIFKTMKNNKKPLKRKKEIKGIQVNLERKDMKILSQMKKKKKISNKEMVVFLIKDKLRNN